jgi:hypothetical protein
MTMVSATSLRVALDGADACCSTNQNDESALDVTARQPKQPPQLQRTTSSRSLLVALAVPALSS